MAITVQHGKVSDVARLGQLAGEASAARTEEARQDRLMEVAQNEAFRQQQSNADLAQRQYEFDKGLELNQYQIDLKFESQKRAQAWELEKMETRSRLDFEQEESKLRKTNQEFEMGMQTISDSHMTEDQKEDARFELQMRKLSNVAMSMPRDDKVSAKDKLYEQLLGNDANLEAGPPSDSARPPEMQSITELSNTVPTTTEQFSDIVRSLLQQNPAVAQKYYITHKATLEKQELVQNQAVEARQQERLSNLLPYGAFLKKRKAKNTDLQWKTYKFYQESLMSGDDRMAARLLSERDTGNAYPNSQFND